MMVACAIDPSCAEVEIGVSHLRPYLGKNTRPYLQKRAEAWLKWQCEALSSNSIPPKERKVLHCTKSLPSIGSNVFFCCFSKLFFKSSSCQVNEKDLFSERINYLCTECLLHTVKLYKKDLYSFICVFFCVL
jgi:hypothetical protein